MYISYSHFAAYKFFCILQTTPATHLCIQPIILFLHSTLCAYLTLDPICCFFCSACCYFSSFGRSCSKIFILLPSYPNITATPVSVLFAGYCIQCIITNHPISTPVLSSPFFVLCSPNSPFIHCFYTYIHDSCFLACIDIFARFPWFYCVHLFLPE
jgi:hypothetical protein